MEAAPGGALKHETRALLPLPHALSERVVGHDRKEGEETNRQPVRRSSHDLSEAEAAIRTLRTFAGRGRVAAYREARSLTALAHTFQANAHDINCASAGRRRRWVTHTTHTHTRGEVPCELWLVFLLHKYVGMFFGAAPSPPL